MNISTVEIAKRLQEVDSDSILTDNTYLLLKELTFRQLKRQNWNLKRKELQDLAHTTTVNTLLFLHKSYPRGFRVSNWIKFMYNRAFKTAMAIYLPDGNERIEIFEFEDSARELDFINRYFFNQITSFYELNRFETEDSIQDIGSMIPKLTEGLIRYKESYDGYKTILYSAIFSMLLERPISLFTERKRDKEYIRILYRLVKSKFPEYMRNNMVEGTSLLNQFFLDLPLLISYERIRNEKTDK